MIKIILPHQIKYKSSYVPANTAFEVEDSDKKEFLKMGGKIVGEGKNEPVAKIENSNPRQTK